MAVLGDGKRMAGALRCVDGSAAAAIAPFFVFSEILPFKKGHRASSLLDKSEF